MSYPTRVIRRKDGEIAIGKLVPEAEARAAILEKIHRKIKVTPSGCWEWQGWRNSWDYGETNYRNRVWFVHRLMWTLHNDGEPAPGILICHRCDNPPCCNPAHLWAGTQSENIIDSSAKARHSKGAQTHCKWGHPLSGDNVYITPKRGLRNCRTCARKRNRLKAGWPEHLAESIGRVPFGHRPVNGSFPRKRRRSPSTNAQP